MHMAQLMPLPLTVSCSSKIQIGFTFLVPAYPGCPGKEAIKWFKWLFWYRLTWLVPDKGPLNGCVFGMLHASALDATVTHIWVYLLLSLVQCPVNE